LDVFLAGSIIMAMDETNHWLVTGDVDGMVKVWNISEYCMRATDEVITEAPRRSHCADKLHLIYT